MKSWKSPSSIDAGRLGAATRAVEPADAPTAEPSKSAEPGARVGAESAFAFKATDPEAHIERSRAADSAAPVEPARSFEPDEPSVPARVADSAAPVEATKPALTSKPLESTRPAATPRALDSTRPAATAKPGESSRPIESISSLGSLTPGGSVQPAESSRAVEPARVAKAVKALFDHGRRVLDSSDQDRFGKLLAILVDKSLSLVHPGDALLEQVSLDTLMADLNRQPAIRAEILTACLGLPVATAAMLEPEVASRLLESALRAKDTNVDAILACLDPERMTSAVQWSTLFNFVMSTPWWDPPEGDAAAEQAGRTLMRELVSAAVDLECLSREELVVMVGPEELLFPLVAADPEALLDVATTALRLGREGLTFTADALFDRIPFEDLLARVSLPRLYDAVLMPIAHRAGWC